MIDYDLAMVNEAVRRVSHIENISEAARMIGLSTEATLRRWREGDIRTPLRRPTREPVTAFLGVSDFDADQMKAVVAEWAAKATLAVTPLLAIRNGS